jgi:hypothetical protein
MAAIALSVAVMFTQPFNNILFPFRILLASVFYLVIVIFGFYRIVELGCQLQFLESEMKVNNESLLAYIYGNDGKSGKVPRTKLFMGKQTLDKEKLEKIRFGKQHLIEIVLLAIFYAVILIVLQCYHIS